MKSTNRGLSYDWCCLPHENHILPASDLRDRRGPGRRLAPVGRERLPQPGFGPRGTCPTRSRRQKKPDGSGIDMATTRNVKWVARLGSTAYGNPTVAGGRVFVGTNDKTIAADPRFQRTSGGMVKCFDEANGKLLWQLVVPHRDGLIPGIRYAHQDLGVCSSPAIEGDRAYVVTCDAGVAALDVHGQAGGNRGPFLDEGRYMAGPGNPPVKLQTGDADIVWRYDLVDDLHTCPHDATGCSILICGDLLYMSTSNGVDYDHVRVLPPRPPPSSPWTSGRAGWPRLKTSISAASCGIANGPRPRWAGWAARR